MRKGGSAMRITSEQLTWYRLRRSGLVDESDGSTGLRSGTVPLGSADARGVARALVGVQAQVLTSAGLSLSARIPGFTNEQLIGSLYGDRTLVKLWGQRRTLHLYDPEDWPALCALFRDRETWTRATVRRFGGDEAALVSAVEDIVELLRVDGETQTRKRLLEQRPDLAPYLELGIGLFMDVVQSGAVCHVQPVGSESHFAHRDHWLPELDWELPERANAGVEWTRRYLATYGPATRQDLAFWLGSSAADSRDWLTRLDSELVDVDLDGTTLFALEQELPALLDAPPSRSELPLRLLHRYDPLLLATRDKSWLIEPTHYKTVWRKAGVVDAVLLVGGRIKGVWGFKQRSREIDFGIHPFMRLRKGARDAVGREAIRVAAYFGKSVGSIDIADQA